MVELEGMMIHYQSTNVYVRTGQKKNCYSVSYALEFLTKCYRFSHTSRSQYLLIYFIVTDCRHMYVQRKLNKMSIMYIKCSK